MKIQTEPFARHYTDGRPYRSLFSPLSGDPRRFGYPSDQVMSLATLRLEWPRFWKICDAQLRRHKYSTSTRQLYRSVLRSFYRHVHQRPDSIETDSIHSYIHSLTEENYSASWIGMNISVLRTVFDKLGGKGIVTQLSTPKRPGRLPEILSPAEARAILAAAATTRDQLLLGLLYGCGLKVGELCRLTWSDVDIPHKTIRVRYARDTRERTLALPPELLPVLALGKSRCPGQDYLFQGRNEGTPLSTRSVQLILRDAVKATDILKTVTCMTLRHSFAIHCIERGESIRAVQEALGHNSIDTTLRYEGCILPANAISPLDHLRKAEPAPATHEAPLFTQPLSLDALALPFRDASQPETALSFYRRLKTIITGRFLCARRSHVPRKQSAFST